MVRKTRKVQKSKSSGKGMTVPQLRHAFERIDAFIGRNGKNVEAFRKEWKKTFGKDVSPKSAKEYLDFVTGKGSRKSQKGGMAPLSYDLRAGADIPYGSFPPYVSDGFGFANKDSIAAVCGKEDITPVPPAGPSGLGSNMVGGKKKNTTRKGSGRKGGSRKGQKGGASSFFPQLSNNFSEFTNRPVFMGSPPSISQDMQMLSKGYNGLSSPDPVIPSFNFSPNTPIYSSYLSPSSVRV